MSPHSQKALYLLGQVYVSLGRLDDAKAAFERAGDDPWALFRRAELLWKDDRKEAIALARRSLTRRPGTDYRATLFLEWAADMAVRKEADRELLAEARALGQTLASKAEKRKRALSPAVSEALKTIAAAPKA
jgi:tetratricopeptide (TPR) repeat protein